MAEYTEQAFEDSFERIKAAFADGFQPEDVGTLLHEITTFTQVFSMTKEEKKATALRLAQKVLDATDIPWLPDHLTLPFLGDVGADALIMRVLPGILDRFLDKEPSS